MSFDDGVKIRKTSLFRSEPASALLERRPLAVPRRGPRDAHLLPTQSCVGLLVFPVRGGVQMSLFYTQGRLRRRAARHLVQLVQKVKTREHSSFELTWGECPTAVSPSAHSSLGWREGLIKTE